MTNKVVTGEVLLGLLGFCGDFIVEANGIFRVAPGTTFPSPPEQMLINQVVQLGWFYKELNGFVRNNSLNMKRTITKEDDGSQRSYRIALFCGVADVLAEYCDDVAHVEQLFLVDNSLSINVIHQHLQKYDIIFPELHNICSEVLDNNLEGCNILNFLSSIRRGVPLVNEVLNRLLLHVRTVFLKQCIAWVLLGELDNDSDEFFITSREKNRRRKNGKRPNLSENDELLPFDWNKSYSLRLDNIPSALVSPQIAQKILFCGKAIKLLNESKNQKNNMSYSTKAIGKINEDYLFDFLLSHFTRVKSKAYQREQLLNATNDAMSQNNSQTYDKSNESSNQFANTMESTDSISGEHVGLVRTLQHNGYQVSDIKRFIEKFETVILDESLSSNSFENLINDVYNIISSKLWNLLRENYHFFQVLHALRGVYLLGKGDFFQFILDELAQLTMKNNRPVKGTNSSSNSYVEHLDDVLDKKVVRKVAKLLDFEEDLLSQLFHFHVNSQSVYINGNVHKISLNDIMLYGEAKLDQMFLNSENKDNYDMLIASQSSTIISEANRKAIFEGNFISICSEVSKENVESKTIENVINRLKQSFFQSKKFENNFSWRKSAQESSSTEGNGRSFGHRYAFGGFSFSDAKFVSKGFTMSLSLFNDWRSTKDLLTKMSGENAQIASDIDTLKVGSFFVVFHNSSSSGNVIDYCFDISGDMTRLAPGSVVVEITIFARGIRSSTISVIAKVSIKAQSIQQTLLPSVSIQDRMGDMEILSEKIFPVHSQGGLSNDVGRGRSAPQGLLSTSEVWSLDMEYYRDNSSATLEAERTLTAARGPTSTALRLRVKNTSDSRLDWDIDIPLDMSRFLRMKSGDCQIVMLGNGIINPEVQSLADLLSENRHHPNIDNSNMHMNSTINANGTLPSERAKVLPMASFGWNVGKVLFEVRDILSTYPVASAFTSSHYPETFIRLENEVSRIRAWLNLRLKMKIPSVFNIVFDAEAIDTYNKIFSLLMKVRLIGHLLQELWMKNSKLSFDRMFCLLRHSLNYFISNYVYYLQVDVVDSEFEALTASLSCVKDFQQVLKFHRSFILNIANYSMINNNIVIDSIEKILTICIRFIAICRVIHKNEDGSYYEADDISSAPLPVKLNRGVPEAWNTPNKPLAAMDHLRMAQENWQKLPAIVPPEELESIRKDFFANMSYLIQIMKKTENRGFLFRLDFNGYFSEMVAENMKGTSMVTGAITSSSVSIVGRGK